MTRAEHDRGRPGERAASKLSNGDTTTVPQRIDNFAHDALLEVFLSAEKAWWLRRAEDFERAKPDPARDNCGQLTEAELRAQWRRLDAMARACRARAEVSPVDHIREDVANVLNEMSAIRTSRSDRQYGGDGRPSKTGTPTLNRDVHRGDEHLGHRGDEQRRQREVA